jgi:hypothetical protein
MRLLLPLVNEADMPVGGGNFDWEIPQLQTEEKTSGKISSGLAKLLMPLLQ